VRRRDERARALERAVDDDVCDVRVLARRGVMAAHHGMGRRGEAESQAEDREKCSKQSHASRNEMRSQNWRSPAPLGVATVIR